MLFTLKKYVPRPVKNKMRQSVDFVRKELRSLQFHLTDHCNLNCKACGHYCPIVSSPYYYTDLHQHEKDMQILRQLFRNIHIIYLVGGEPLLHPDPATFINITRFAFPKSELRFLTNGILLSKASAAFWDACRNTNTRIDVTVYPPMRNHREKFRVLCEAKGVKARIKSVDTFHAHLNLKGNSDKQKAFKICRRQYYCPLLKQGRIYTCPMTAYVHYLNKSFNYKIAVDGGIDIHSKNISGLKILRELNRPIETCKWCSYDWVQFPWANSNRLPADWDAAEVEKNAR